MRSNLGEMFLLLSRETSQKAKSFSLRGKGLANNSVSVRVALKQRFEHDIANQSCHFYEVAKHELQIGSQQERKATRLPRSRFSQ